MDVNVRAFRVVQAAISEHREDTEEDARKLASQRGGLVGGPSRAKSLSARRRREIARAASNARWHKKLTKVDR